MAAKLIIKRRRDSRGYFWGAYTTDGEFECNSIRRHDTPEERDRDAKDLLAPRHWLFRTRARKLEFVDANDSEE